jgi:hypothetical protein
MLRATEVGDPAMLSRFSRRTRFVTPSVIGIAVGAALSGAGLMYILDPRSGRRRRAMLTGQVNRGLRQSREFASKVRIDAENRTRGLLREARIALQRGVTDDEKLAERVRSALGRLCSHPGALDVQCASGVARLTGDILSNEVERVLTGVRNVRGVKDVTNELQVHESADSIPALQGESKSQARAFEYLQDNWSPAPRVLAGALGLGLLVASSLGFRRARALTAALGMTGTAVLLRAVSNRPLSRLVGVGADAEEGFSIQKSVKTLLETGRTTWNQSTALRH